MVQHRIERFGTIDILANVVGIAGPTKDVWDMSLAEWQETLAVNLDSVFLGCKYVLPEMIRKGYGRVINFSSGTGKQPLSHRTPYAASKMAVIGFTRTLAADVGRYGITVNAICPGGHEERSLELARGRAEYSSEAFDEEAFRLGFRATHDNAVIAGWWTGGCCDNRSFPGIRRSRKFHGTGYKLRRRSYVVASRKWKEKIAPARHIDDD